MVSRHLEVVAALVVHVASVASYLHTYWLLGLDFAAVVIGQLAVVREEDRLGVGQLALD